MKIEPTAGYTVMEQQPMDPTAELEPGMAFPAPEPVAWFTQKKDALYWLKFAGEAGKGVTLFILPGVPKTLP